MKILLFTDSLGAGGAQRQLIGLAVMLKEHGFEVKVCTYHNMDFFKSYLDENNVANELIPDAHNSMKRIWAVYQYFKQERPDWVIAYQETPSLVACAAKFLGYDYKLIVSERNTTQVVSMNERVRFFLYRLADKIVPNSYSQERYLAEHHPWMKKKLQTIINFVDLEYFSYVEHRKSEIPEIAVAASIWPSKNTLGFIDAIRLVAENGGQFHVSWYGKSDLNIDYFNKCQRKIEDYGLGHYIDLKEKTKHIKEVYQKASFFCLPSFYEGTPNVICEAISCGLPVICSNVCDNSEYVRPGFNGFLFNPNNIEDMATKLSEAINMSMSDYTAYQKNSRDTARLKLSKERFVSSYLEIIKQ